MCSARRTKSPELPPDTAAAYRAFKATRFFSSLDGLRALSVLAVVWFHTLPWPRDTLWGQGNKGVTLFFAISGFLIVTLILRAKQSSAGFALPAFWVRRGLRIFPLYYAVLLLYVLLVALVETDATARAAFWGNLPAFATFTSNWFVNLDDARVIFYFAWSLAAEEQFYLLWPVVERWLKGWWPLALAVGTLAATQAVALALGAAAREHLGLRIATSVQAGILFGVVVAHLLHRPETFRWMWQWAGHRAAAPLAALAALGTIALAPDWGVAGELAIAAALAALVATCVIREDHGLARVLRLRSLGWIGTVSYGIYLLHMIAVNVVRKVAGVFGVSSPWLDFAGGAVLAIALASVSFLTFERYFLGWKERWFPSDKPAAGPAAAASKPAVA